jgi:hypothetical protein
MKIDVLAIRWDGYYVFNLDSNVDVEASVINTMWMVESAIVDGFVYVGLDPKDVMRLLEFSPCYNFSLLLTTNILGITRMRKV